MTDVFLLSFGCLVSFVWFDFLEYFVGLPVAWGGSFALTLLRFLGEFAVGFIF